ncbi:MAG: phosphoglucomutase/phosphomannomutase family protein [Endomicrobiales bacterium]|nr:phosphoglucomutase/phosphomannomutase family protein [Endomicrobiales bacterium]
MNPQILAKPKISFGTDGWRGVIAEDFTFDNLKRVARAIALYLKKDAKKSPKVTIGYDTRFNSPKFAQLVAETLSNHGCSVVVSSTFLSTPAISSSVIDENAQGGIVISASHNPCEFNGLKFKTANGCSAPEEVTRKLEQYLDSDNNIMSEKSKIIYKNLKAAYFRRLRSYIDFSLIKRKYLKIISDPMHGASIGYLNSILTGTKCKIVEIHSNPDPMFGGLHPEPIEKNLDELKKTVKLNGADLGVAADGDADRIGIVDDEGRYYTPHQSFSLLLYYLCNYKGLKGKVVQTISLGYLSERIAKDFNLEWIEVPVGFKYIAKHILKGGTLIGGEESGGFGYGNFLPERDGILNALMFIEMLSATGKPLSVLLKEIEKKYGASCFLRTDFKKPARAKWTKNEFVNSLKTKAPDSIAGLKIKEIKDYDGIEFILEDDSWLLLRPSGTEPIIRVYCESPNFNKTKKIIKWGEDTVLNLRI